MIVNSCSEILKNSSRLTNCTLTKSGKLQGHRIGKITALVASSTSLFRLFLTPANFTHNNALSIEKKQSNFKTMKKVPLLTTIKIYLVIYVLAAYIEWDFFNPLRWILEIPNMKSEQRGIYLFSAVVFNGFVWVCYNFFLDIKKMKQQQNK